MIIAEKLPSDNIPLHHSTRKARQVSDAIHSSSYSLSLLIGDALPLTILLGNSMDEKKPAYAASQSFGDWVNAGPRSTWPRKRRGRTAPVR